jgi:hypothetical protein
MRLASTIPSSKKPNSLFLREPLEPKPKPISANPGTGNHSAYKVFDPCKIVADGPTVVNVTVAVPPLLATVTGLVLPNEQVACDGVKLTVDVTTHDRVTLPVYPLAGVTVTVDVTMPPGLIEAEVTPAASEYAGGDAITAVTVRLIVVLGVKLPDVPVTVTDTGPGVAELLADSVRTLVLVVVAGLNEAVTPAGRPEAARVTLPVKPFVGFTVIVLLTFAP